VPARVKTRSRHGGLKDCLEFSERKKGPQNPVSGYRPRTPGPGGVGMLHHPCWRTTSGTSAFRTSQRSGITPALPMPSFTARPRHSRLLTPAAPVNPLDGRGAYPPPTSSLVRADDLPRALLGKNPYTRSSAMASPSLLTARRSRRPRSARGSLDWNPRPPKVVPTPHGPCLSHRWRMSTQWRAHVPSDRANTPSIGSLAGHAGWEGPPCTSSDDAQSPQGRIRCVAHG
jgi:hypothetical protein